MATKYYNNLYDIEDPYRRKKYLQLIISSLKNDMSKWTEEITSSTTRYYSPIYNGTDFCIAVLSYTTIAYVQHNTPIIPDHKSELISEDFPKELKDLVYQLREKIFTPEIYEIEKIIGNQHSRKEKLDFLEIEQMKEIVEDTYQDWLKNENEISAKMIAKIMYSYRKDEELYTLWQEKFEDNELITNELKNIKG